MRTRTTPGPVRPLLVLAVVAVLTALLPGAPAYAAPAAPTGLQLVGGARTIGVEFVPPPGGDAFSYDVRVNNGAWQPLDVTETERDTYFGQVYALPGRRSLKDGATYRVSVAAISWRKMGPASAARSVTTLRRPAAETFATEVGDGQVSVGFARPAGGSGVSGRRIEVARADDLNADVHELDCTGDGCVVDGLGNGVSYRVAVTPYRVLTMVSGEERLDGPTTTTTVVPAGVRGEPLLTSAVPLDGGVRLGWRAPQVGPGSASDEASHEVAVDDGEWRALEAVRDPGTGTWTTVVDGLDNGYLTQLRVRAVGTEGTGPASRPRSVVPAGRPGPVREVVATAGSRSVLVQWEDPDDDGGSPLTRHVVTDSAGRTVCGSASVAAASCRVTRLAPGSTQVFTVRADNTAAGKPGTGTGPGVTSAPVKVRR